MEKGNFNNMTKFIIDIKSKGWFRGMGLHHASLTFLLIAAGHFISAGIGGFLAVFAIGWYASREYGTGIYPPVFFEIMDFVSPAIIAGLYLIFF